MVESYARPKKGFSPTAISQSLCLYTSALSRKTRESILCDHSRQQLLFLLLLWVWSQQATPESVAVSLARNLIGQLILGCESLVIQTHWNGRLFASCKRDCVRPTKQREAHPGDESCHLVHRQRYRGSQKSNCWLFEGAKDRMIFSDGVWRIWISKILSKNIVIKSNSLSCGYSIALYKSSIQYHNLALRNDDYVWDAALEYAVEWWWLIPTLWRYWVD